MQNYKKNFVTRTLAWVLTVVMVVFMIPMNVFAEVEPANWVDDVETARYWPIPHQGRLVKVSKSEALRNPTLRFIGGYTRPDGREVVRLAFSAYNTATSGVWKRLILKPDAKFNAMIDWDKSGMAKNAPEGGSNYHDRMSHNNEFLKFEFLSALQGGSGNLHFMKLGTDGTWTTNPGTAGVISEVPIDLVLNEGKSVKNLSENFLIQMRLMDTNFEKIYSTTIEDNQEVPYSSYTMSTYIPSRINLKAGVLDTDVVRNVFGQMKSASSYIKYNEDKGYIDLYTRRTYNSLPNLGNGENYGFRQTFDESFIDILKPQDQSKTVAQIFIADGNDKVQYPSGDQTVPKPANRIDFSLDQIKRENGVGVVEVSNNAPNTTFLSTGGTTGYGMSTVVRYHVDKDKLKEKFGNSDIVNYEFYSTIIITNNEGVEEFKAPVIKEDIDLKRDDIITLRFD